MEAMSALTPAVVTWPEPWGLGPGLGPGLGLGLPPMTTRTVPREGLSCEKEERLAEYEWVNGTLYSFPYFALCICLAFHRQRQKKPPSLGNLAMKSRNLLALTFPPFYRGCHWIRVTFLSSSENFHPKRRAERESWYLFTIQCAKSIAEALMGK